MLLGQQNPNYFHRQQSPHFFSETQMSDITDISDENMKIITGLPAWGKKLFMHYSRKLYIWEMALLLFSITHTPMYNMQVHENANTAFELCTSRNPNLQVRKLLTKKYYSN